MDCIPPGSSVHADSPGGNTEVGCHALFQGIFPTHGSNPGLLHCRWILYHLSHHRSPRILEWVAYLFSRGSSRPRNWTRVTCIAGGFFTSWATREVVVTIINLILAMRKLRHLQTWGSLETTQWSQQLPCLPSFAGLNLHFSHAFSCVISLICWILLPPCCSCDLTCMDPNAIFSSLYTLQMFLEVFSFLTFSVNLVATPTHSNNNNIVMYYSIPQFSCSVVPNSLQPHGLQHARLSCPSPTPGVCGNSCPLSQWCHPAISSSVVPFSSCLRSFPASGSFQLFASGGQSIGVSASASVLSMNI